jgi:hypothetical protein
MGHNSAETYLKILPSFSMTLIIRSWAILIIAAGLNSACTIQDSQQPQAQPQPLPLPQQPSQPRSKVTTYKPSELTKHHQTPQRCKTSTVTRPGAAKETNWALSISPPLYLGVRYNEKIIGATVVTYDELNASVNVSPVTISPDGRTATASCSVNSPGGGHTNAIGRCYIQATVDVKTGDCGAN